MQKIMFNDRYGLTQAVLNGTKTMTRRVEKWLENLEEGNFCYSKHDNGILLYGEKGSVIETIKTRYKLGEVVAVAQSYNTICTDFEKLNEVKCMCGRDVTKDKSWFNKMFVRPDLMPHQIQITDIKFERLQDITDEDCLREGIRLYTTGIPQCKTQVVGSLEFIPPYGFDDYHHKHFCNFDNPRDAFASLINRPGVGRKGLWEENPFVMVYEFKLLK